MVTSIEDAIIANLIAGIAPAVDKPAAEPQGRPKRRKAAPEPGLPGKPSLDQSVKRPTVLEMPRGERPRERLRDYGASHLSNAELIAILLRTGMEGENVLTMANRLLSRFNGLDGLARGSFAELCAEPGLSEAKTCQLMAALELGRRFTSLAPGDRAVISSPQDVANLLQAEMSILEQEHLKVLLLNTKNQVLRIEEVYVGNVNSSVIRAAEVFRAAVRGNAPSIIIVHNHPSGDPTPSPEDAAVTKELLAAGKLLSIELIDHIVIGSGGRYISLKEKKLGFG